MCSGERWNCEIYLSCHRKTHPSLIIQEYPHTKGFSFYSKRGCWGNYDTILFLVEPNGPETILWGHWDPSLPSYIIPTNSQVPGRGVPNLHLPEVSPWADAQLTQHTGNRVESLCGLGRSWCLFCQVTHFPSSDRRRTGWTVAASRVTFAAKTSGPSCFWEGSQ